MMGESCAINIQGNIGDNMAVIWYVHGSGGSEISFTWLRQQLSYDAKFFSYQVNESTETCIDRLACLLLAEPEPVILLGHSLGGIISLACAARTNRIARLITMCAPFGGLQHASLASMFNSAPMFRDLRQYGSLLKELRGVHIIAPHLAIVASHGMPHINETNDGVVTLASQTALTGISYTKFPINHFEVLLSPGVATVINNFLLT
jgi:pimeloyl-ACP methyl ester carboxylesterase